MGWGGNFSVFSLQTEAMSPASTTKRTQAGEASCFAPSRRQVRAEPQAGCLHPAGGDPPALNSAPDGARVGGAPRPHLRRWRPTRPQQAAVVPRAVGHAHWGFVRPPARAHGGGGPHMTGGVGGACGGGGRGGSGSLHHFPPGPGVGGWQRPWRRRRWRRRLDRAEQGRRRRAPGSPSGYRLRAWASPAAVNLALSRRRAGGAPRHPASGSWGMA